MKRLDLTLATSRTYISCQLQTCVITLLDFFYLRIVHAYALKMLNKKSLCLVCKYFFLSIISLMLAVVLYFICIYC